MSGRGSQHWNRLCRADRRAKPALSPADQAFPLELKVPNAATCVAMAEAEDIAAKRLARFADLEEMVAALEAPDLETSERE